MTEGIKIHVEGMEGLDALFRLARQNQAAFSEAMPNTSNALYDAALIIENAWKGWASMNHEIPGVKNIPRAAPDIVNSIKRTPNTKGAMEYTISSNSQKMTDFQNGKDETIDMKAPDSPWLNGKKSRINKKDGSPYLIVPFAWGTGTAHFKNIVPQGIQKMLRSRALSVRLKSMHTEPNAKGEDILRHEYTWGGRVSEDEARHTDTSGNLTSYDAGMVRMQDTAHPSGNGGKYFTFRVISAKSAADKWIQHRHIDRIDVVGGLKREFEDYIKEQVQDAFLSDYQNGF
mgnify:CR=1 FL=1